MKKIWLVIIAGIAVIIVIPLFLTLIILQTILTVRFNDTGTPDSIGLRYDDLVTETSDGVKVHGWFIPGQINSTIIFAHGVSRDKAFMMNQYKDLIIDLHKSGYNVILFDFRTHGDTIGGQRTFGIEESRDVSAVIDYLVSKGKAERVGAVGCSLGAGTLLIAAGQDQRLNAVIADSPYWSAKDALSTFISYVVSKGTGVKLPEVTILYLIVLYDLARHVNPEWGFDLNMAAPYQYIKEISPRAVFLIQGKNDEVVPSNSAERLFQAALEPKELWSDINVGHCEASIEKGQEFREKTNSFFAKYLG